jgi:hypothetical protein
MDSLYTLIDIDRIEPKSRENYDDQCRERESLPYCSESRSDIQLKESRDDIRHI